MVGEPILSYAGPIHHLKFYPCVWASLLSYSDLPSNQTGTSSNSDRRSSSAEFKHKNYRWWS